MKKISIITTFYNAEQFIVNAINSIAQQIISDDFCIEYVIVDDKSEDNSRNLIEKYFNSNPVSEKLQVILITPDNNLGCGGARKYGIDNATGDYYMFLDADDYYINRDFVKRAFETIEAENADIVEYGILFNQPNGNQQVNKVNEKIVCENNPMLAELLLFNDNIIKFNVWTKIYKRHIVESYPYSTERTFEDVRTVPLWIANAHKIVIMPSVEINYRAAGGSIIRNDMIKTRIGTITAIASLFEIFKNEPKILKAMYKRSMVDLEATLNNHSSKDPGFNEMSRLNTYMLSFLYPNNYKEMTYHVEDDLELKNNKKGG